MNRNVDTHTLGAYETSLSIISEFFPDRDATKEPAVSDQDKKRWILNAIGFRLMSLGRLREGVPFYERSIAGEEGQDWSGDSLTYQNLAELHASLGALEESATAAQQALDLSRRAEKKDGQCFSLAFQGLANHLLGNTQTASDAFAGAEKFQQEIYSQQNIRYLFSLRGIQHADYLRRTDHPSTGSGNAGYARRMTEANLDLMERNHWPDDESRCHRILGDLDADSGNHTSAREHYEPALKIARGISHRSVLIEALLGRGRWQAKYLVGGGYSAPGQGDLAPTVNRCLQRPERSPWLCG